MITIPVLTTEDGSICASAPAPANTICPITTPAGVEVYMPGDEQLLAERLAKIE